jgi:O-antigen ligase
MTALGLGFALFNDNFPRAYRLAAFGVLITGLLLSLSRGPWIGAIIIIGVYVLLSRRALMRSIQAGAIATVAGLLSLLTPFGRSVIGLLPVIGGDANDTIDYRQQLLDAAWGVMQKNPLFGSGDYLQDNALQSMRQGQGIIDIVNTYLQVGLKSGYVGLGLFVLFFASVLLALFKALQTARAQGSPLENYCRAYLATLVGMLVTIFTTSSEGQIPHLYWVLGAMGVALSRIVAQAPTGEPVIASEPKTERHRI